MKYPALICNRDKLFNNAKVMREMSAKVGVDVCAVTKGFCAIPEFVEVLSEAGIKTFGDSRVENLKKLEKFNATRILIRMPMISEVEEVVKNSEISLNSEMKTMEALSKAAVKNNVKHGVILMLELGDLREGFLPEDVVGVVGEVLKLSNIELKGLGVNFNCYGAVIPTPEKLNEMVDLAHEIENTYNIKLEIISGGNSGSSYLLRESRVPKGITQFRFGQAIIVGTDGSYYKPLPGAEENVFILRCEIIELKTKNSLPDGERGVDAFGSKPVFEDKGKMKRAIVACGRQDIMLEALTPVDKNLEIIGASSDHMIIDATKCDKPLEVGDTIDFCLDYGSILLATNSEYVFKTFGE